MNQILMIALTAIAAVVAFFLVLLSIFFFASIIPKVSRVIWLRYKIYQIEKAQKEMKKNARV